MSALKAWPSADEITAKQCGYMPAALKIMWLLACGCMLLPTPLQRALAHPGGLNAEGCHNNRKTGDYHCHGAGRPAPAAPPPQEFRGRTASPAGVFRNCAEARAAGAAPIYAGQPGYGPHLDRDGDGVACEPYRGR